MTHSLDATATSFLERAFIRALRTAPHDRPALRAMLRAHRLLGMVVAQRLLEHRHRDDPLEAATAQAHASDILVYVLREALSLLGGRFDKLPDRKRPHYGPTQRFRILRLRHLAGLSQEETAKLFRVATGTISRWECQANPQSQVVGSTVTPVPPIRRYSDVVHHLAQTLAGLKFGGYDKIAHYLARAAGWKISKTTVARYLREVRIPDPRVPQAPKRAVVARFVHHVWHLDLTQVPGLLGSAPRLLALVLDGFSRMPLAWRLYDQPPGAAEMCALVDETMAEFGKPRHLVVDKGGEFSAHTFRERLAAWRVRLRFCSAGNHRANSRLERFWLTLKVALGISPPSPVVTEAEIHRALIHYAFHRPHGALRGATPAELYLGVEPAHLRAGRPPRGRRGDSAAPCPVTVLFLDGDERFPILSKVA